MLWYVIRYELYILTLKQEHNYNKDPKMVIALFLITKTVLNAYVTVGISVIALN